MSQPFNASTLPTFDHVVAARARLGGRHVVTPLLESHVLNERVGGRVLLKPENLQRVGAFKFRGAYNAVSQIDRARHPGGVVACSSGNHAQGVAAAAAIEGMSAVIVMPSDAPALKIARTRSYGAEVILYERATGDRDAIARRYCNDRSAAFVHPYDNADVMAGQGTVGLEIMEQAAAIGATVDDVLVCCAGGGFVSGVSLAVKHFRPQTQVYSVEPAGFDDFARSLASGQREHNDLRSGSICDALLTPQPGELTFAVARHTVAGGLVVSDDDARAAMRFAFQELKLVVEPGGAVALAAILAGKISTKGRTIACVLSGGNVDPVLFSEIVSH